MNSYSFFSFGMAKYDVMIIFLSLSTENEFIEVLLVFQVRLLRKSVLDIYRHFLVAFGVAALLQIFFFFPSEVVNILE